MCTTEYDYLGMIPSKFAPVRIHFVVWLVKGRITERV